MRNAGHPGSRATGHAAPHGDAHVEVAGETLRLLPERAAYWERARTLLVADAHFGKAASFRALGVPVPGGTTLDGLQRLDAMLARTAARRIAFLGDYLHAREGRAPATLDALARWHEQHPDVELLLVRGNHDRDAGDPPRASGVRCVDAPLVEPPFVLAHHPTTSREGFVIAGHLHPAAFLEGAGRQRERLPCFWLGASCMVLPAFGEFTGMAEIEARAGDRAWVVAGGEVIEVTG
jgi:DNA ligase-associated metallophosphoesterase